MPKLKDLHAGWNNRWWPIQMAPHQHAEVPSFTPKLAAE